MLILITGLPGSGKSTLARAYAAQFDAVHLNSDLIRRDLGLMGHYSAEDKARVYQNLLARTRQSLAEGQQVVVDSTFYLASIREPFHLLAQQANVPEVWVEVKAEEATIRQRMLTPRQDSEADFEVYKNLKKEYQPLSGEHLVLWSDQLSIEEMTGALRDYLYTKF